MKLPGSRRSRRYAVVSLVVLALVGAGATVAIRAGKPSSAAVPDKPATLEFVASDLAFVQPHALHDALAVSGTLEARREATVRAKVAADVKSINVREGDAVRQNQLLAQLDTADLEARLADRSSARDSALAQFELARKNRDNSRMLHERQFISQNALDSNESTYEANRATLESANAQVESARIALRNASVTAPIAGIVAKRFLKVGEKTAIDSPVVSIVDLDSIELEALVPAGDVAKLAHGMSAQLKVEGISGRTFAATLDRISPATEAGTRSIAVFFTVPNPDHVLKSGMFANGIVDIGSSEPVPALPATAIQSDAGTPIVWTIEGGKITRRTVALGRRDTAGNWVEIVHGPAPDMPVIATKLDGIKEGAPATVKTAGTGAGDKPTEAAKTEASSSGVTR